MEIHEVEATIGGEGPEAARLAAGLRLRVELQPVAGPGARVMPPTYAGEDQRGKQIPAYAEERRRFGDGELKDCVLLDSIASQANRQEEALQEKLEREGVRVPDIVVDQGEFGTHSALEFSHRCFDSWVEDALDGDTPFGTTETYRRLSSVINRGVSLPLLEIFPVGLLLGCWASRKSNPQGTTRIARAITSEIIAVDAEKGVRPSSKVDIHHVSNSIHLTETEGDRRFAVLPEGEDPKKANLIKGKQDRGAPGRPSIAGYGNVVPGFADHGGITMSHALQQSVFSLAAIRGTRARELGISTPDNPSQDLAARRLLVALALTLLEAQAETGWDLRSGCQLVPASEPTLELVGRLGDTVAEWPLIDLGATDFLRRATVEAEKEGLTWNVDPLQLKAAPEQLELLRRSLGMADTEGEDK